MSVIRLLCEFAEEDSTPRVTLRYDVNAEYPFLPRPGDDICFRSGPGEEAVLIGSIPTANEFLGRSLLEVRTEKKQKQRERRERGEGEQLTLAEETLELLLDIERAMDDERRAQEMQHFASWQQHVFGPDSNCCYCCVHFKPVAEVTEEFLLGLGWEVTKEPTVLSP